jgi:SAM-dependent methyltransferase
MRGRLKKGLDRLGLLAPARRVRQEFQIASFRRRNARFRHGIAPDGAPIPPVRLILLVTGTPDVEWFLTGGRLAADSIRSISSRNGVDIDRARAILDFGCGSGRVARCWAGVGREVHGCDYNRRLVDWCQRHLRFGRFEVNDLRPPLPYPDGRFDLVYALSVFTHLPEELQRPWIEELQRILEPGGHLILSVHGRRYREELRPEERRRFDEGRLVVRMERSAGTNLCGAYHPIEYVRETLARGFTVRDYVPEGALGNPHQDLVLLRKALNPR